MTPRVHLFFLCIALASLALFVTPSTVQAQDVPPFLAHQGRLFGADNLALSGVQTLTFRAYDAADDTGVELWSETIDVTTANGYYSVVLGQTSAVPDALFDGSTRYLGVTVGDATVVDELTPRLEVTSVAYALKSAVAENAIGALTPDSVTLNGGGTVLDSDGTVTVGGATIAPDGQISLGAATINTDGSIVVGNTTINPDGSISVSGNPVIGSDGGISADSLSVSVGAGLAGDGSTADPLVTTDLTLTGLEAAGCTDDQVPQFNAATGWSCQTVAGVDTDTTYEAGSGLTMTGPNNTFSVDFGVAQQAIVNSCVAGESIQTINPDGSVVCETDDDTTYAAGAGVDITAGTISLIDTVDDDTTYTAGAGLTLTGTQFDVDAAAVQTRVTGVCAAGEKLLAVAADGSVTCAADIDTDTQYAAGTGIDITAGTISLVDTVDDNTTYNAGTGLTLSGTTFDVDTTAIQARVTGTCAAGYAVSAVNGDGSVVCSPAEATEQFLRGAALAGADATLDGMRLSTDRLVLAGGGFGGGERDLLVTAANSPYILEPGVHEFRTVTVEVGGLLTTRDWNGVDGGRVELHVTGHAQIDGTIDLVGKGYRGGKSRNLNTIEQWIALTNPGEPGESWTGAGNDRVPALANGGGGAGGGGDTCSYGAGGGGGSFGTSGATAASVGGGCSNGLQGQGSTWAISPDSPAQGGVSGATYGDAALSTLNLGSGGGGSGSDSDCVGNRGGHGGDGGGALGIYAASMEITGVIDVSGDGGGNAFDAPDPCTYVGNNGGGGGGAGGAIKLKAENINVGAAAILRARGGGGGAPLGSSTTGGAGGDGRVYIEANTAAISGTLDVDASVATVVSDPTATPWDGSRGKWISPLFTFSTPGHFQQVDLYAVRAEGVSLYAELCVGATAAETLLTASCKPVAPSGSVDAPAGEGFARIRLDAADRSDTKRFALEGVRVTFGE